MNRATTRLPAINDSECTPTACDTPAEGQQYLSQPYENMENVALTVSMKLGKHVLRTTLVFRFVNLGLSGIR